MTEREQPLELTSDQLEAALALLEICGLEDYAEVQLEMMGQSGTVRYGLGRCAEYLMDRTPGEIYEMVMTKLAEQPVSTAGGHAE
ncbi:MAG TPA: hypothetical protein VMR18_01875 [Candidatus Saccharimonadales bacterium]|jgi:hypothetical protein|nr:hypothetical protein [Candidatus Saccharimonadales bacterium]